MATPTNTFLTTGTNKVAGMREDLSNYIYMLSPEEVPFMSWAGKGKATNSTAHEWQTIALRSPAQNKQPEGNTFAPTANKVSARLSNVCQISTEVASVSGTTQAVDKAGRSDELDFQMLLKGKEMKRDIEFGTLLGNFVKSSADPRQCAGLPTWAGISVVGSTGGTAPTGDGNTAYVAGTAQDISTNIVNDVLESMWKAGARPTFSFMSTKQKRNFDKLATTDNLAHNEVQIPVNSAPGVVMDVTVSIYKSAFGSIKIALNQWLADSVMYFLDERDEFRPKVAPLPGRDFVKGNPQLNHDGVSQAVIWEGTLEAANPNCIGLIAGLNLTIA